MYKYITIITKLTNKIKLSTYRYYKNIYNNIRIILKLLQT